ncbi:MAG: HAD family phosphatase [Chromatiales bacterium]|jgi:Cof subfamily protein (haloacid dehalogenase superfamily)|nr:HAD family phosphatase [Chromatiales bacterium]
MAPIRLLAIDIDGTLLGEDGNLPPENVEALEEAVAAGVTVALCTGRMLPNAELIADQLTIDPYVVAYNGAKSVAPRGDGRTVIGEVTVPADRATAILRASADHRWLLNFYHDDKLYTEHHPRHEALVELYLTKGGYPYRHVSFDSLHGLSATKLVAIAPRDEIDGIQAELEPLLGGLNYLRSEPEYLEIMAPGVDKATALAQLSDRLGIPLQACAAFGDSGNDVGMLRAAGTGVAMGNANALARASADMVMEETSGEGAVATFIRQHVL